MEEAYFKELVSIVQKEMVEIWGFKAIIPENGISLVYDEFADEREEGVVAECVVMEDNTRVIDLTPLATLRVLWHEICHALQPDELLNQVRGCYLSQVHEAQARCIELSYDMVNYGLDAQHRQDLAKKLLDHLGSYEALAMLSIMKESVGVILEKLHDKTLAQAVLNVTRQFFKEYEDHDIRVEFLKISIKIRLHILKSKKKFTQVNA